MSYIGNQPTQVSFQTDTFSGTGSQTAFTMSIAPAGTTSMLVAVTGVVQDPSTYSVVGTTLTFSAAPPSGTNNISVRYLGIPASGVTTTAYRTVTNFTATAGQTTFTPPSYTVGYIDVYRNGVRLAAADYTATNGTTVVLTNAASAGDSVVTESFYVSSVNNAIPATAGAINLTSAAYLSGVLPVANGGTGLSAGGPAFNAYLGGSNQSMTSGVATKITLNTELYDTNNAFNSTGSTVGSAPAYSFNPQTAGYYQISIGLQAEPSTLPTRIILVLYKNGALFAVPQDFGSINSATSANPLKTSGSMLMYLNGSTDYVEFYVYIFAGTAIAGNGNGNTWMTGALVRAA